MKVRTTLTAALTVTALAAPAARATIPSGYDFTDPSTPAHLVMTHRSTLRVTTDPRVVAIPTGASANAIQGIYSIH